MRKGSQKGFNQYEIFGDITVIYIENRKNEIFEVLIDTEDLGKLIDLNYSWCIAWGINRKDYYVLTTGNIERCGSCCWNDWLGSFY